MNDLRSRYITLASLDQYLLFHYGSDEDQLPFAFGPKEALHFPERCVKECVDTQALPQAAKAIDLGCAVGRSTFELARFCHKVVGVDKSPTFINAAKQMQQNHLVEYSITEEGSSQAQRKALLPQGVDSNRVEFRCADVMELVKEKESFDLVLAANLICRIPDPVQFLGNIHHLMNANGQLIIISPYSWSEEFTALDKWLLGGNGLETLKSHLADHFHFKRAFDIPFLLRVHKRKYEWGVSQATIWTRK
jgi:putative 4-mercaptohistidine N1-methyltranferase